jgi:cobalamin synthase
MKKVLTAAILTFLTFIVSRFVFEPANLYYELPWLDIPMHIWGGFLIGLLIVALSFYNKTFKNKQFFFLSLFIVMVIWEVYEYQRGVILYDGLFDYFDTLKDVVFGFLGGYLAYKKK